MRLLSVPLTINQSRKLNPNRCKWFRLLGKFHNPMSLLSQTHAQRRRLRWLRRS